MYDDLVKRLRYVASYDEHIIIEMCKEAADEIEELQTYLDLYKDIAAENQRVARKVIDSYPKWIPCSERLPEEQEIVLTWGKENKRILLDWMFDNKWCCVGNVTHWMPLPEPPEKESEHEAT